MHKIKVSNKNLNNAKILIKMSSTLRFRRLKENKKRQKIF